MMPAIYSLPAGADFPRELVKGLLARHGTGAPEDLARVTLWLNTRRMQRRVREMLEASGARLLPRLRLVTDLATLPLPGLPMPVPRLRRRLELGQLVARLLAAEPGFAPGTGPAALAESLAGLMDEMQMEGVAPEALETPGLAENHAAHWERSLAFIRIVARYFEPGAPPDTGARQRRAAEALAALWSETPPPGPVIVAGSTASRGATALFMQAVARLPQGALVLPGVDTDMPGPVWRSLTEGPVPAEDHPQYRFARLLADLGLEPGDLQRWTEAPPPAPARNRLISLALRPAPVTDQWLSEGAALPDLVAATEGMTLIEAADPRAEATALALVLRQAAEEGTRAALVTPDRMLTRRVAAQLDRWGIRPDDSAGQPLALSPPGRFLRQVAALMGRALTIEGLLALLKHPLTATGSDLRGPHLLLTRDLELELRRRGPAFPDVAALQDWAGRQAAPQATAWAEWLATVLPTLADAAQASLAAQVARFRAAAEALAAGPGGTAEASQLWRADAGEACRQVLDELEAEAGHGGPVTPEGLADLLGSLLAAGSARSAETPHPRIAIWGTIEARVQGAELVLLAGLNDGVWPQMPPPDPWLSRQMRLKAGLLLPERQIGLAAHDFQQAVGAPRVVLSRARRDAEAETVPSRWLNRLVNLMGGLPERSGPEALRAMRARGDRWLALAEALDRPAAKVPAAPRPAPRPPLAARPRQLAVTGIRTLIRDPYAVYARHILRLYPLDPIRPTADARERGTTLHRIVESFLKETPDAETPAEAEARLIATTERVLAEEVAWPAARRFWRMRIAKIAPRLVADEAARRALGRPVVIEERGGVPLKGMDFRLTAKPDRIDLRHDGQAVIYDYKSGKPPSIPEQKAFDKQLFLEAALAERGGFAALGPVPVAGAAYIQLGGEGAEVSVDISPDIIADHWMGLHRLIARYMDPAQGYAARRAMQQVGDVGDYDHLARFGEWDISDMPQPEDVA